MAPSDLPETQARILRIEARLRSEYGQPRHYNPADPLDDLVIDDNNFLLPRCLS